MKRWIMTAGLLATALFVLTSADIGEPEVAPSQRMQVQTGTIFLKFETYEPAPGEDLRGRVELLRPLDQAETVRVNLYYRIASSSASGAETIQTTEKTAGLVDPPSSVTISGDVGFEVFTIVTTPLDPNVTHRIEVVAREEGREDISIASVLLRPAQRNLRQGSRTSGGSAQ